MNKQLLALTIISILTISILSQDASASILSASTKNAQANADLLTLNNTSGTHLWWVDKTGKMFAENISDFTGLATFNSGIAMSSSNIAVGGNQVNFNTMFVNTTGSGTLGVTNNLANNLSQLLVYPSGSSVTAYLGVSRTNSLINNIQLMRMGSDVLGISANEFGLNTINTGNSGKVPFDIYINGSKYLFLNTNSTISNLVPTKIVTSTNPELLILAASSAIGPHFKMTDANASPNSWELTSGFSSTTDGIFNIVYNTSNVRMSIDTSGNLWLGAGSGTGNIVYRCTVAGNDRAGVLTTVSTDCGTAVDTKIRVQ